MRDPDAPIIMVALWCAVFALGGHAPARMQFGNFKNPFASKNDGATTIALTIGFNVADRGQRSVLGQLDAIAADADTSTSEGIARLCGDTSLALLRRRSEWVSCSGTVAHRGTDDDALLFFDRLVIQEAAKFDDRDSSTTIDAALSAAGLGARSAPPTLAVVCVIGCVTGDREAQLGGTSFSGDAARLQTALEELAAAANDGKVFEGEVSAFELLWVPGGDDETLDADAVMIDWPELMPC